MNRILSIEQLQNTSADNALQIVDVRSYPDYLTGHIPGAVHFDVSQFNRSEPPVAGLLPTQEDFDRVISELGISPRDRIVVYDDTATPSAGRFAWTMMAFSHKQIAILDGGYTQWQVLKLPVSHEIPEIRLSVYNSHINSALIADREYILNNLENLRLIDCRSQAEFSGDDIRSARGGHIPSAINIDWQWLKSDQNPCLFKTESELKTLLRENGIRNEDTVETVCYCQSHQRSTLMCLVLEQLGYANVRGYPGAWSDWGNRDDTPITR